MKSKVSLSRSHLIIGLLGLLVLANNPLRAGTGKAFDEPQQPVQPTPEPQTQGVKGQNGVVLTRATYLLKAGREDGNPKSFAQTRYRTIKTELATAMQSQGVFDGDAIAFAELANLNAELQATELMLFWLDNPQFVHMAHGYSFDIPDDLPMTTAGEIDYASIQP
ncbi:MAG: hypothetical protein AAFV72_00090 [Cyanobacteria bacterium J06635_1]